ncbi:MAG TPA: sulfite exporter TauE/SafE family protein, partial [Candidatus Absconditabacterales bacterium]|nr:sulfite exporter TauE/SafE family protein [Candidatus Absconditabacterales bacterium]
GSIKHVKKIDVHVKNGTAIIGYEENEPNQEDIIKVIEESGYTISDQRIYLPWLSKNIKEYKILFLSLIGFLAIYFILKNTGIFGSDFAITSSPGLGLVLLIGLTAGFSSCMAIVGGLVLAITAKQNVKNEKLSFGQKIVPHFRFNAGRIIGFGILGGVLGLFGSMISLSPFMMSVMTLIVGAIILILGINLTNISPRISTMSISLPTGRLFRKKETEILENKGKGTLFQKYAKTFGSGVLTFFLPCGFTFAMQMYAISTGNFWMGMIIMALFAIGTVPGLLGVGSLTSIFTGRKAKIAYQVIGVLVVLLGIYNISNSYAVVKTRIISPSQQTIITDQNIEIIDMQYTQVGLEPTTINLEVGKTYKIKIDVQKTV